jgi:hypothetical protein
VSSVVTFRGTGGLIHAAVGLLGRSFHFEET